MYVKRNRMWEVPIGCYCITINSRFYINTQLVLSVDKGGFVEDSERGGRITLR
jgi:hypothetical protein